MASGPQEESTTALSLILELVSEPPDFHCCQPCLSAGRSGDSASVFSDASVAFAMAEDAESGDADCLILRLAALRVCSFVLGRYGGRGAFFLAGGHESEDAKSSQPGSIPLLFRLSKAIKREMERLPKMQSLAPPLVPATPATTHQRVAEGLRVQFVQEAFYLMCDLFLPLGSSGSSNCGVTSRAAIKDDKHKMPLALTPQLDVRGLKYSIYFFAPYIL